MRPPQQRLDVVRGELLELVDLRAREQRAVDLEVRVLGRGADQRHQAVLDRGQQRVLLRLVEAMDLVEEEDRRAAAGAPLAGARDHLAHLRAAGLDGRQLLERSVRVRGGQARQRGLAGPGRAVQHHRMRVAGLERGAQRRAGREQVLLADELVERGRPHPRGERSVGRQPVIRSFLGRVEQPLHRRLSSRSHATTRRPSHDRRARVGTDRHHQLRRPAGAGRAAPRAVRRAAALDRRARVRGRQRGHASCSRDPAAPSWRSTAPVAPAARPACSPAAWRSSCRDW